MSKNDQQPAFAFVCEHEQDLPVDDFVDILTRSGLAARRPVDDRDRLSTMLRESDLIVTARNRDGVLVGLSRALTDRAYVSYLSDLAVCRRFQRRGIGQALIQRTHELAGPQTKLVLLSAPAASEYYPHVGFTQHPSAWTLNSTSE